MATQKLTILLNVTAHSSDRLAALRVGLIAKILRPHKQEYPTCSARSGYGRLAGDRSAGGCLRAGRSVGGH